MAEYKPIYYRWIPYRRIKHGFFLEVGHTCGNCNERAVVPPFSKGKLILKYCPNCGKPMLG